MTSEDVLWIDRELRKIRERLRDVEREVEFLKVNAR